MSMDTMYIVRDGSHLHASNEKPIYEEGEGYQFGAFASFKSEVPAFLSNLEEGVLYAMEFNINRA